MMIWNHLQGTRVAVHIVICTTINRMHEMLWGINGRQRWEFANKKLTRPTDKILYYLLYYIRFWLVWRMMRSRFALAYRKTNLISHKTLVNQHTRTTTLEDTCKQSISCFSSFLFVCYFCLFVCCFTRCMTVSVCVCACLCCVNRFYSF